MAMKRLILTTILLGSSKTLSLWKAIGNGSPSIMSITLSGTNQGYAVQGDKITYKTYEMTWDNSQVSSVKDIDIGANANILIESGVQSDNTFNVVASSKTIFRFNSQPAQPINFEEYPVPTGHQYSYPYWAAETNYMFVSARSHQVLSGKKLYRLHSDKVTDVKVFNTGVNSRSFGVLHGTGWVMVSLDVMNQRKLFDYTNGYEGGTNSVVQTHSKPTTANEIGFLSPEDGRGYYVVGTADSTKKLYTVKNDGTALLTQHISTIDTFILYPKWIKDTDLCVVTSWAVNFAIVNFMDTNLPQPSYFNLPGGGRYAYQAQVWRDYKVLALPSRESHSSHLYKLLTEMPCAESCLTCDGIFRKKCFTCVPHSSRSGDVCNCDLGYYSSAISPTKKECLPCSTLCGTCSGSSPTQCLTCKDPSMERKGDGSCGCPTGKYLSGTRCISCDVSSGKYLSGSECLNCDAACSTCSGGSSGDCLSCDSSKGKFLSGASCISCDRTCKTCSGPGPNECTSCEKATDFIQSENRCMNSCPRTNQYRDSLNTCQDCPEFCEKCLGITGACSSCNSTYILISSNNTCEKAEKPLLVKSIDYSSLTQRLTVSFNQAIITPNDLNSALKIELKEPQNSTPPSEINHRKVNLDDSRSRIIIEFDFKKEDKQFEDHQILVTEVNKETIKAERDPRDIFKAYPITKSEVTSIESNLAETAITAGQGASYSLGLLSIILMFVSLSMAVIMVKLFQLLFFLLYIDVNLPSNAARFVDKFRKNMLDYFPAFLRLGGNKKRSGTTSTLRRIIQSSETQTARSSDDLFAQFCFPHKKLEENGQTCSVFINLGSFITQLVLFLILKLIVYSIKRVLEKKQKKQKNQISRKAEKVKIFNEEQEESIEGVGEKHSRIKQTEKKPEKLKPETLQKKNVLANKSNKLKKGYGGPNASSPKKISNQLNKLDLRSNQNIKNKKISGIKEQEKESILRSSCLSKILDEVDTFLNMAYFFNLFKAMQLKAVIGAMSSILSIDPWSITGFINIAFSVLVILFYFVLLFLVVYFVRLKLNWKNEKRSKLKKAGFHPSLAQNLKIIQELKKESKENKRLRVILALSIIQDFFIPLGLTIFIDTPVAQIATALVFMSACLFVILTQSPFKETRNNILEGGNRAIYILILIVFLINLIFDRRINEKARFNYIGFGIIGLILLLLGLNIVASVYEIVEQIKMKLKKEEKEDPTKTKKFSKLKSIQNEAESIPKDRKQHKRADLEFQTKKMGFEFLGDYSVQKGFNQQKLQQQEWDEGLSLEFDQRARKEQAEGNLIKSKDSKFQIKKRRKNHNFKNKNNQKKLKLSLQKRKSKIPRAEGGNQVIITTTKLRKAIDQKEDKKKLSHLDLDEFFLE